MTQVAPSSRFQVYPVPIQNPGSCFVCRSANVEVNGPFVDTGMSHVWWNEAPDGARDGVVYICASCVRNMAHVLDVDNVDVQTLIQIARAEGYQAGVEKGKKLLDEFIGGYADSVRDFGAESSVSADLPGDSVKQDEPGQQRVAKSAVKRGGSNGVDDSKRGPDDVPSDPTAGDLFGDLTA